MAQPLFTTLNNGIEMPLLGLGVYDMYGKEAEGAVHNALEIGYRLIDTAKLYNNEIEIGNAVRQSGLPRKDIFITTKLASPEHGYEKALKAFDDSMRKINCEYIDLYLIHWPQKTLREETWKALEKLYHEGRVKAIGVANFLMPFLKQMEGYATVTPAVNQIEFSPYLFMKDELAYCEAKRIQLQAYTPLVRGKRMNDPKLLQMAAKYKKTPAQVILRWLLQHGVSAIPKSVHLERLRENFDVFDFELKPEDFSYINTFNENLRVCEDPMDNW